MTDSTPSAFSLPTLGEVSATVNPILPREVDVMVPLSGSVDADWRGEFQAIVNALSRELTFPRAGIGVSRGVSSIHYTVAADFLETSVQEIRNIVDRTNDAYTYNVLPARKATKDKEAAAASERARLESELAERVNRINNPE